MIEPMDNERKIEKLLRAYAKKRRADAGDPLKLHPVTRRRLQDEVARQFAEVPEEESISLWQLFRQQWALLLVFSLVIFFLATMAISPMHKAKSKTLEAKATLNLKVIGLVARIYAEENDGKLPASLESITNEMKISTKDLTDPVSGKRFVYVAGGEILDELQTNSVLAYSPEDKKGRAVLLADGRVQTMNAGEFEELNRHGLIQHITSDELATRRFEVAANTQMARNLPAAVAAPPVASGTLTAGGSVNGFGGSGGAATDQPATLALVEKSVAFKTDGTIAGQSGANNNSQRYRQTLAVPAMVPPVLTTFEVQQSGNNLAVVDRDGSVYNGSIRSANSTNQSTLPAAPATKAKDSGVNKNEPAVAQSNYFFRVAGQNRTTKQNVVFTGNLMPLAGATGNAQQNYPGNNSILSGRSQTAAVTPPQSLFANSRITGTVTVDVTNQMEIDAVPVAP